MASYFCIDFKEVKSKECIDIIIDIIRKHDAYVKSLKVYPEIFQEMFKPDYYDDDNVGCGNWVITIKGIIDIIYDIKEIWNDESKIRKITYENHKTFLDEITDKKKYNEYFDKFKEETIWNIQWCYKCLVDVLCDMVNFNRDKAYLRWF